MHYSDVRAAQAALRSGSAPIVLGALPFDVHRPAALLVPDSVVRADALPDWPTGPLPAVRITAAVRRLPTTASASAAPRSAHRSGWLAAKGVLSRALQLAADAPLDARVILRRLVAADPAAYGYLVDLTQPATTTRAPRWWGPVRSCWSRVPATV